MDQLSAHLDRGWDLAQKGDIQGAASSARRAIEVCPESPEAHNLLGFVAALEGDCDEAVEAYQQAFLLDDTYVEAMLNAAELMVHPLGDYDDAIRLCDQILELTDYADEIIDARLIIVEARLAQGDPDGARRALGALPEGPYESATHSFLAGRAYFELGEQGRAEPLIAATLSADPHHGEAHYYAGLIHEAAGNRRDACQAFLDARQCEAESGMPPWAPNADVFRDLAERAIAALPSELGSLLVAAEVFITDLPGPEMIVDGVDLHALVLVEPLASTGEAATPSEHGEPASMNDTRVFIYALNVLRTVPAADAIQQCLCEALAQEVRAALIETAPSLPSGDGGQSSSAGS
jgi:tetratricopeptide (TPR) repeat protein